MNIHDIGGRYKGNGSWYDSIGQSMNYRIAQTTNVTAEGFDFEFRHDFDDGSVVEARLSMKSIAPNIYSVHSNEVVVGHGYAMNDMLRYHIRAGDSVVEVSCQPRSSGMLEIYGSSTKNADGNYIAWREELYPVQDE